MEIYLSNSGQEPIYAQITRQNCLQGAVDAARLGGIGYEEVAETLRLLWEG